MTGFWNLSGMIAPISQSNISLNYALRALTHIAAQLKADARPSRPFEISTLQPKRDPLLDAASKIARILIDAQSYRVGPLVTTTSTPPRLNAWSGLSEVETTVLVRSNDETDPDGVHLERMNFGSSNIDKWVFLLADAEGKVSITTAGPTGSVTTATGPLRGNRDSLISVVAANTKSTTITLASDVDVDLVEGSSVDEFIAVASKGSVEQVYAGAGDDRIAIIGGPSGKVDRIEGGTGNDDIIITAVNIDRTSGGTGDDYFNINSTGTVSSLHADEGDDTIYVHQARNVRDLSGGDGDDKIRIWAGAAQDVTGGNGDDEIRIRAAQIESISGGRGDDRLRIENTSGSVSTVYVSEGDGNDVIETNGPLKIRSFSDDGTQTLDLSGATVSYNEDRSITIGFGNSNDSITVFRTGAFHSGKLVAQPTSDGGLLITAND